MKARRCATLETVQGSYRQRHQCVRPVPADGAGATDWTPAYLDLPPWLISPDDNQLSSSPKTSTTQGVPLTPKDMTRTKHTQAPGSGSRLQYLDCRYITTMKCPLGILATELKHRYMSWTCAGRKVLVPRDLWSGDSGPLSGKEVGQNYGAVVEQHAVDTGR